ncbi:MULTISPECIES: carbamoyl-phosphate synthase subunit L [Prochlorococcus]|uniref:carbamoyl-phosphate synthase subunit L n=1 Tax=Prochlorococcus TaxID=1218 RepID=UPI001F192E19|nr:carbamoyl-phosphate synthase subunit L [Prochlorococcus marinus]
MGEERPRAGMMRRRSNQDFTILKDRMTYPPHSCIRPAKASNMLVWADSEHALNGGDELDKCNRCLCDMEDGKSGTTINARDLLLIGHEPCGYKFFVSGSAMMPTVPDPRRCLSGQRSFNLEASGIMTNK